MTQLETLTQNYWLVSHATRGGTPAPVTLTTQHALELVSTYMLLPPERWLLKELMHVVRFNIIEGNTKWQNKKPQHPNDEHVNDSVLIPFMRN